MSPASPVMRTTTVACPPDEAFALFTDEIGSWWPLPSHSVFGAESSGVAFEGDALVERSRDGTEDVWGRVVQWEPPHSLTFTWHPGRPASEQTEVTVTFRSEGSLTRVELVHRGWDTLADGSERRTGYASDGGWTLVLAALHRYRSSDPALVRTSSRPRRAPR